MLRKKIAVLLLSAAMAMTMLSGCGDNTAKEDKKAAAEDQNKDDASEAKEEEAEEAMDAETSAIQPIEPDSADETTSQEGADSEGGIYETEK